MGLLERALRYKQQLNNSGRETLIDKIKGPAESNINDLNNYETIDTKELDEFFFTENKHHIEKNSSSEIKASDSDIEPEIEVDDKLKQSYDLYSESNIIEEEIILADESNKFTNDKNENKKIIVEQKELDSIEFETNKLKTEEKSNTDISEKIENASYLNNDETDENLYKMPEFNDYAILYEILKEFIQSESVEEIYNTILFSVMGQLGVSSVSILSPSETDYEKWVITQSNGIKIPESELIWDISHGILEILKNYRGVIDVEDLKDDASLREDYYRFVSVNARLIVPIMPEDKLSCVIMVGEKIDSQEFTSSEIEFLSSLSETASFTIKAISSYEKSNTELLGLRIEKEILSDVEIMQHELLSAGSVSELAEIIRKNFYSLGIETYAIFLEEPISTDFYPAYYEINDNLGWNNSGFRIKNDNRFISFLLNKKFSIMIDNFVASSVIADTFGSGRVEKMGVFISYPFIIAGRLSGFLAIFKINPAVEIIDVDIRLQRIVRFIFPYVYRYIDIDPEKNRYLDITGMLFARIEREFSKALELNIPVSILSFSIKNYKRFFERFGKIEMNRLFDSITELIKTKLQSGDFSARIDRNKFIIILPGKDKKYSSTLSGIIKNHIIDRFNTNDFKLLLTFISASYPEDGKDLFSILEILD